MYIYVLCSLRLSSTQLTISATTTTFLDERYPQHSLLLRYLTTHSTLSFVSTGGLPPTNHSSLFQQHTHNIHTRQMDVSKFLQLQTSVAHPLHIRPQAQPQQQQRIPSLNTSDSTDSTDSMSRHGSQSSHSSHSYCGDVSSPNSPPRTPLLRSPHSACDEIVRCSRCHRSATLSSPAPLDSMISFGLNLYYCGRCASMVGYKR